MPKRKAGAEVKKNPRGRFWALKKFAVDRLEQGSVGVWKLSTLCGRVLGSHDPESEKKFVKTYVSRWRSFLLGDPQQLLLPIKIDGVLQGYRPATRENSPQVEKLTKSYVNRALRSIERAHRVLNVDQNRELMPVETINSLRAALPPEQQMKLL